MPNHVPNNCSFEGPIKTLELFHKRHFLALEEDPNEIVFDFNTIIPMPKVLIGTTADFGRTDNNAAKLETGFNDWYEWSIANWGTKWNAYDLSSDISIEDLGESKGRLEFSFDTAWSPAEKVFAKLVEIYPDLYFKVSYFDEGGGFGGYFETKDGKLIDHPADVGDEIQYAKAYEAAYGTPFESYEDEDEEPSEEDQDDE